MELFLLAERYSTTPYWAEPGAWCQTQANNTPSTNFSFFSIVSPTFVLILYYDWKKIAKLL
jgi:hypothetical protein